MNADNHFRLHNRLFQILDKLLVGCLTQKRTDNILNYSDAADKNNNADAQTDYTVNPSKTEKVRNNKRNNSCKRCNAVVQAVLTNRFQINIIRSPV